MFNTYLPILKLIIANVEPQITRTSERSPPSTPALSLIDVPTPFKKTLFWPDTPKSKPAKEKVPSVATSKQWQEYHEKKEEKKIKKQAGIEERKKKREERDKSKEAEVKNKKKKTSTPKNNNNNNDSSWFCAICDTDVEEDMIQCMKCKIWLHEQCAMVKRTAKKYYCTNCK